MTVFFSSLGILAKIRPLVLIILAQYGTNVRFWFVCSCLARMHIAGNVPKTVPPNIMNTAWKMNNSLQWWHSFCILSFDCTESGHRLNANEKAIDDISDEKQEKGGGEWVLEKVARGWSVKSAHTHTHTLLKCPTFESPPVPCASTHTKYCWPYSLYQFRFQFHSIFPFIGLFRTYRMYCTFYLQYPYKYSGGALEKLAQTELVRLRIPTYE